MIVGLSLGGGRYYLEVMLTLVTPALPSIIKDMTKY